MDASPLPVSIPARHSVVARTAGLLDDKLVKASDVEPRLRERQALAARLSTFDRARAAGQAGLDEKITRLGAYKHQAAVQVRTAPLRESLHVNEVALAQV